MTDTAAVEKARRKPFDWKNSLTSLLFLTPMLLVFGMFAWLPIGRAVIMAFQETNLIDPPQWVGTKNFERVLGDPLLMTAVRNTLYFAGLALVIGFPLPLILSVLMAETRKLQGLFSALVYLPVIIPPVVSILLWKFFYDANARGVFNTILGWVGIDPIPWLQSSEWAMPSLVLNATWSGMGSTTIIYLAALKAVPTDLYDAADIDGAGLWSKVRHILLPQIRPVIVILLILQLIATVQVFLEPYVFTGGGPANATITILMQVYNLAFYNSLGQEFGAATALSLMLAVVLALLSALYFLLTSRKGD